MLWLTLVDWCRMSLSLWLLESDRLQSRVCSKPVHMVGNPLKKDTFQPLQHSYNQFSSVQGCICLCRDLQRGFRIPGSFSVTWICLFPSSLQDSSCQISIVWWSAFRLWKEPLSSNLTSDVECIDPFQDAVDGYECMALMIGIVLWNSFSLCSRLCSIDVKILFCVRNQTCTFPRGLFVNGCPKDPLERENNFDNSIVSEWIDMLRSTYQSVASGSLTLAALGCDLTTPSDNNCSLRLSNLSVFPKGLFHYLSFPLG